MGTQGPLLFNIPFAGLFGGALVVRLLAAGDADFDLDAEIRRGDERARRFANMILKPPRGAGVPLEAAYIALNYDVVQQRVSQQMNQVAQSATQRAAQTIASGARRPAENGTSGNAAATTKIPIPKTREQFAEMKRRAAAGEVITFT